MRHKDVYGNYSFDGKKDPVEFKLMTRDQYKKELQAEEKRRTNVSPELRIRYSSELMMNNKYEKEFDKIESKKNVRKNQKLLKPDDNRINSEKEQKNYEGSPWKDYETNNNARPIVDDRGVPLDEIEPPNTELMTRDELEKEIMEEEETDYDALQQGPEFIQDRKKNIIERDSYNGGGDGEDGYDHQGGSKTIIEERLRVNSEMTERALGYRPAKNHSTESKSGYEPESEMKDALPTDRSIHETSAMSKAGKKSGVRDIFNVQLDKGNSTYNAEQAKESNLKNDVLEQAHNGDPDNHVLKKFMTGEEWSTVLEKEKEKEKQLLYGNVQGKKSETQRGENTYKQYEKEKAKTFPSPKLEYRVSI